MLGLLGLLLAVVLIASASVTFGVKEVTALDILAGLTGARETLAEAAVVARLPRTALALVIGAALAVSGAAMQAVTRNPIADPGILGVSSGASLAVVTGIAFFGLQSRYAYMAVAIVGGSLAALAVYAVGSLGRGGPTPLKLALAGAATSAAFASLISAILLPRVNVMTTFRLWQIGGVGGATWDRIAMVTPVLAIGLLICVACAGGLNSLALGDDVAAALGENVLRTRLIASLGAVVLCGAATAIAGPIGFVGLVVPHAVRLLAGVDYRWVLPLSALAGGALLVAADLAGRVATRPAEIDVGIVTALIGAPFFIWIVRRQRVREL